MPQRKKILEDLEALNSIKNLAESYEEVAVVRMQKLKDSVLQTRDYLADLSDVYVDLKASYEREVKDLIARRKRETKQFSPFFKKPEANSLCIYPPTVNYMERSLGRLSVFLSMDSNSPLPIPMSSSSEVLEKKCMRTQG